MPIPNVEPLSPGYASPENCPECNCRDWVALFESHAFPIARCARCGLVRTLGVTEDGAQYPPFDQRGTAMVRLLRTIARQLLRERRALVQRLRSGGRLLDFGCGSGEFARLMTRAGFEVVGVEPFSLGRPLEEPGLRLWRAPLEQCQPSLGDFDVITLWQVLEHVREPGALLASLLEHLRPRGLIVVSVPNFASWQSRMFGPRWFHLDPPRHISHFDRRTLGGLFERLGLDVLEARTFHLEYGPVGWVQSAINSVLPRSNFLFEFVKDRGALTGVSRGQTVLNLAGSIAAAVLLVVPAVAVEMLAALRGAGSVLTLVARRKRKL